MGRDANTAVQRTGKFWVSREEYSGNRYPPFCPGFAIVLSADVVRSFVDVLDVIPKFRFEDVYIGMLANKAGVEPTRNNNLEFTTHPSPQTRCKFQESTLVRHGVTGECLFQLFKERISINQENGIVCYVSRKIQLDFNERKIVF